MKSLTSAVISLVIVGSFASCQPSPQSYVRYQLFAPQGATSVNAGTMKLDVITGESWLFQSGIWTPIHQPAPTP
ncbi:MAG: hypothetical protein M3Y69_06020 [Verrucomicrobiota bacterium]|nr:hypothetical protein [Verrucomicrobiota bacterium]